ncbi:putative leucine-rich repeat-containing protein DDB_G0290503 [Athalia rosae]|uniref:putative leucine-rich repeat-containing protein DDB_G0290503 n=1 Tax=Athalia rosae TaxID=37344 RepID=UPI0020346AD8|nr:putative leucine-rich repeat-containing protein DDB_G0290503 [Athalia rosae]
MDKQSGFQKQYLGSSTVDRKRKLKHKVIPSTNNSAIPSEEKIRKLTDLQISSNLSQISSQPLCQIDDALDKMTEIWNHVSQNELPLFKELDESLLAKANDRIKILERDLRRAEEEHESLERNLNAEDEIRTEIMEKQNLIRNSMSLIQEQSDCITESSMKNEKDRKFVEKLYTVIIEQRKRINDYLSQQDNNQVKEGTGRLKDQLVTKVNELMAVQSKCKEFEAQINTINCNVTRVDDELEKFHRTLNDNQIKHRREIEDISNTIKLLETTLNKEQEKKHTLEVESLENERNYKELLSQYKILEAMPGVYEKQITDLTSETDKIKTTKMNVNNEIAALKNTHLAAIWNRDLELADYRQQIQNLELKQEEENNQLLKVKSDNEKLSKTSTKILEDIEDLERTLAHKDDKISGLRKDLINTIESNRKAKETIRKLNAEFAHQEENLSKDKILYATYETIETENSEAESVLRIKIAEKEKELKEKSNDFDEIFAKVNLEKSQIMAGNNAMNQEIKQKSHKVTELVSVIENLQQRKELGAAEYNDKLQKIKESKECKMGHENEIQEKIKQIHILDQELSNARADLRKMKLEKNDKTYTQDQRNIAELTKLKSAFDKLQQDYITTQNENKDLHTKSNIAQNANAAINVGKELERQELSLLMGTTYAQHTSMPISSTPISSSQGNTVHFDFSDSSDISAIDGMTKFDDAERRFEELLESNKTANWK